MGVMEQALAEILLKKDSLALYSRFEKGRKKGLLN